MDVDSLSEGEKEDLELHADHPLADSPYWEEAVETTRRARSAIRDAFQQVRQRREERRSPSSDVEQRSTRVSARSPSIQSEDPLGFYVAPSTPHRSPKPSNVLSERWGSSDVEIPPPSSSAPLSNIPNSPSLSVGTSPRRSTPLTSPTSPTRRHTKPSPSIPTPSSLRLTSPPLEFPQSPVAFPDHEMDYSPPPSPSPLRPPRRRSPAPFPDLDTMPVDSHSSPLSQASVDDPFLDRPASIQEMETPPQDLPAETAPNAPEEPVIPPEEPEGRRLRTRTFNQMHPYLYDRVAYKRQLQHHPDAIVRIAEQDLRHSSPAYEGADDSQLVPASPPLPRARPERRATTDESRSKKRKRTPPRPVNRPMPRQRHVGPSGAGAGSPSAGRREHSAGASSSSSSSSSSSEDESPGTNVQSTAPVPERWYPPQFDSSSDDDDNSKLSSSPRLHRLQKGKRSPSVHSVISIASGSEMAGNSPRGQSPSPRPSHSPERYSSPPRRSPVSPLHTPRSSSPELLDRSPRPVHKPSSPIPVHDISDSENEPEIDSDQDEAREVYPIFSRHYGANASPAKRAKILRPSSRSNAPSSSRRPRADAHRTTKRSGHGSRARRRGEPRQHRSSAHVSGSRSKPRREHGQTSHAARLERDPEPAPRHPRRRRHDVGHNVTTFVTWSRLESGRVHRGPVNVDLEDEEVQQALARPRSLQAQPAHSRAVPPPSRIRPRPPPSRTHPQPVVLDARHPPPAPPFRSGVRPPPSRTRSHPVVFDRHSPPPSSQTSAHHADVPINAGPPSTDRTRVELAKETAPLPGGHSLGQDSYLGKGWLRELLDCLTGDWKPHHVLLECRIDELPWSLASSSSVQNLSDFLGPACDAFFKFATSPLVQTELPVHMATMHRLCALVSWISLKAPPTGDEASWAKILACCTGLIHSIEQWHNFSTSALDVRHPYLYWFAVELLVRLHDRDPKNRPPLNANSKIPIAVQTGGLVQMLLRADYREKAFPPPGSIHLHNPAPLEDAVKSIWVCLIHVCNAFSDAGKRSSLPKFPPFWGLVADSWTATGDQSSDVAVSETVWHVVFALCPLTQYGPLGFSSSECHAPPPWRLVIHGISKIRLKGDHEQDARFPRTVLATRDDYIHTIVLRCLRLAQAWKWRADEKGYMIVDKLADIYRSRKFADLLGEHANFAPFVKENDPSLLKKPYDSSKDNTFSALLKLAYAIGSTREGQLTLTKLMAALVAVGRLQLSGEDLEPQQASALFNRFSAVALAVELDRSSAGFERRLQGLSSEVLFAESGEALRAICRQAVKHFTMQAIRVGVSLDAVLAWFGKMSACLVQEYCQGAHRPTTSPEYTKAQEAAKGIRKLLSLLAKAAAYSIEVEKVPNPKLLQCEGISEIFSIHQGNNILRPVGKSVQELVKVYLDFCQSGLPPTPALADPAEKDNPAPAIQSEAVEPSTVVGGGNQGALTASTAGDLSKDPDIMAAVPIKQDDADEDSQDYWKDDDLICFPELLALPEPSAPSQPTVEELQASSILDIVDERVQKPIFTLIGHFGVQAEAEEQLVRKEWIECWSHCMLALLHGGTKDLANCLTNRLSPWGSIPNPWRHYARLSVSYLVLSRYPAAYRHEHCRTFYVGVWLDCLVAYRPLGKGRPLEDRFMSLLLRVDKGQHPLLQNLPLDFQDDLTSESNVVQNDAFHNTVSAMSEIEDNRLHTGAASVIPFLVDMLQSMKCVSDTLQGEDEKRYRKFVHYVYESIESEPSFWSDSTVYNAMSWTRAR